MRFFCHKKISLTPVLGAQLCSWEQAENAEVPTLRKRLAVFSERLWNPDNKEGFDGLLTRLKVTDDKLTDLLGKNNNEIQ